jgi:hypothetical protein
MKKIFFGTGVAAICASLAFAMIAGAQTTPSTTSGTSRAPSQPMVLQVGPKGEVLLRGTIDTVSSGSMTVKSWGGDWTVNVSAGAQVLPNAVGTDITKFQHGDFVGVQGMVSQTSAWTIDAKLVRDWTYRAAVQQQAQQNAQAARELMQSQTPRNYQGTAGSVTSSGFTLAADNSTTHAVVLASGAKISNRNWMTIAVTDIRNGDTVRVWGTNASGTITAQIVRDISLPAMTTSTPKTGGY